jgi:Protein of unknown function (Hypoth_ymh)
MVSIGIADPQAALEKVRQFIGLLENSRDIYRNYGARETEEGRETDSLIHESLPLIVQIADRADPDLVPKLQDQDYSWPFYKTIEAAQQLAGRLSSLDEAERILGPRGPKLAAANLHPWIWNAAVSLWDDGHRREAVQAAATALFDQHLPAKLGVPGPPSAKDRISLAFTTDPPSHGKPRLRLDDYPDPSPNWTSQHEGAKFFGMGCAQLIRNLATHTGAQPDEQSALEELAALSGLARLIDRAKVVH